MFPATSQNQKQPCGQVSVNHVRSPPEMQSLPEEEQQRVLGEEKMLGANKKGATSPASKKSSPDASKVTDVFSFSLCGWDNQQVHALCGRVRFCVWNQWSGSKF